jgi:hypothetical protein
MLSASRPWSSKHVIRTGRRENKKIIYVYDFINMWTFLVGISVLRIKLQEIYIPKHFSHGEMPDEEEKEADDF